MPKITKKTRIEVLLEQNNSDIKAVLEYTSRIPKIEEKIEALAEGQDKLIHDVEAIKVGQREFEERVTKVEHKLQRREMKAA